MFSVATPYEVGLEAEVAQGMTLGDAAEAAGVCHYIYSSVGGAERDSKRAALRDQVDRSRTTCATLGLR